MSRTRTLIAYLFLLGSVACADDSAPDRGRAPDPDPAAAPPEAAEPRPAPPQDLRIQVSPRAGAHGDTVTIRAHGFEPGARIGIGIGPPRSEYEIFDEATANDRGEIEAIVPVPDWTEPGRDYLFVARPPAGDEVTSEPFRVTDADGTIRVTGELTAEGVECPALRGDDGRLYTLAGPVGPHGTGDRVTVEGVVSELSICMQGTTIQVVSIRPGE